MLGRARVTGPSHLTPTRFPVRDKGDEDDCAVAFDVDGLQKVYKGREVSDFAIGRTRSLHLTSSEHFHKFITSQAEQVYKVHLVYHTSTRNSPSLCIYTRPLLAHTVLRKTPDRIDITQTPCPASVYPTTLNNSSPPSRPVSSSSKAGSSITFR